MERIYLPVDQLLDRLVSTQEAAGGIPAGESILCVEINTIHIRV